MTKEMQAEQGHWVDGVFRMPIRMYYEDTDMGGMVYHARYVSFFERVRTESIHGTCLDVDTLMRRSDDGGEPLIYVVRNINVTYHSQAKVGDLLIGHSAAHRVRAASVEAWQWLLRDGELVADAKVLLALVGPDGTPRRWPSACRTQWNDWVEQATGSDMIPARMTREA